MGKKNKGKKMEGPSNSGSQQSTSGYASGSTNKEKDSQKKQEQDPQKQQPKPQGQQHQPKAQGQQQQPKAQGQQQQPKAQGQQQQPKAQGQQQQPKAQGQQQQPGPQGQQQQPGPQGQQQQPRPQGQQQQSRPQGQQQQAWGGQQQQPGPQGQQQQSRPQGQQQQAWGGQQQQPGPQGQQQQSRPQGQQQQAWGGQQQQPGPQGQQQQPRPQFQQQQPRPQFQQQQPRPQFQQQKPRPQGQQQQAWGGQQQQPGPQGQQQPAWGGQQQQSRPQGQQQQPGPQGQQQQPGPQGQQQQPRPQFQQQQPRPQGQQQQPGAQGQQQLPRAQGQQQLSKPQGQQQQPQPIHERGSHGSKFMVETNYLTLDLNNMPDVAYHYDVKIELYNIDPTKIKQPPKKFLRPAFLAYAEQVWPKFALAYDGMASAYSPEKLPEDKLNANDGVLITVKIEDDRVLQFRVTMKRTLDAEVDLNSLRTYQRDRIFDKPMRALQCIEVVLRTPCHEKGVRGGRSFFMKPEKKMDLGDGYELWYGLYQAAMLCDTPLLNVDVSHKSFPSQVDLVEFYQSQRYSPEQGLKDFLKGLTVLYKPPFPNATSKRFKFNDVVESSKKQMFTNSDGKKMSVANYYAEKKYKLKYPDLPCLHVGSTMKNIYIPLELVSVPDGQAIMRKDTEMQVRNMIRYAATATGVRKQKIMDLLKCFKYYAHPIVERFGISVGENFIKVEARLLQSPTIKYSNKQTVIINQMPGEWKQRSLQFFENGAKKNATYKWAILNYSKNINQITLANRFVKMVLEGVKQFGMCLQPECTDIIDLHSFNSTNEDNIRKKLMELKAAKISIVFVVLPIGRIEQYSKIKQVAEMQCGVVTQCIKSDTICKKSQRGTFEINRMTVDNILLKVNAKLNGINHTIADESRITLEKIKTKIMFVGADVSHPSPLQKDIPSIVGVVASHDAYGTQYNMQYRLQEPGEETIRDMKDIFYQHLLEYKKHMNDVPTNIIYYRDGVSDGQFKEIENVELNAMRAACTKAGCKPQFTCIIVVKRHHTRFFPRVQDGDNNFFNNVKAGTVVDTTIIHPGEEQFFMVSHKAIQGTSKPTRYNVIVDEAKIPINDLQTLTYNLCHLFPRCNRSVSYPAPAYLSHLVGLRGRAYIQGGRLDLNKLNDEYEKRTISADMKLNPMYFV